jgi:glycosyltransferase involved in cell wall biosynthesis
MPKITAFTGNENQVPLVDVAGGIQEAGRKRDAFGIEPAGQIVVSVVVPTLGRPELLNRCLGSLVLQRFDPSKYEIIVVDDGPSEKTRAIVMQWALHAGKGPLITYIASYGPHGPAAARNRGWKAARGSVVAFTDDDTVPRMTWLETGMAAFEQSDVDAVWGRIVMPLHHEPTDYELDAKGLERAEFVTANCFCRKSVLERLNGFDERFRFAWREDADLYFNLLSSNARVVHLPGTVVVHPIRPAKWGVSLSQQKKVLFDALLYKKHPDLYRKKIRAGARWDYYLIVLLLLIAAGCLAGGQFIAAVVAGAVWAGMTARFCLMRLKSTVKTFSHVCEMILTSMLIPPLAVYWRMIGALRFRTFFF